MKIRVLLLLCAVGYCTNQIMTEDARSAIVEFKGLGPYGAQVSGKFQLDQANRNSPVKIRGVVHGLPSGEHGIHVHEKGDCQNPGEHFNPFQKRHGGPSDPERHAGDLGNIKSMPANPNRASFSMVNDGISLFEDSQVSIVNRVIIIHVGKDDLGRGANGESLINGNSGGHLACGLIVQSKDPQVRGGGSASSAANPIGAQQSQSQNPRRSTLESGLMTDSSDDSSKSMTGRKGMEVGGKIPSNLNLEGIEQPDYTEHVFPIKSTPLATSRVWKVGNVYEYDYVGWIATGMPAISPQLSGGSIKGVVVVEPKDESTVVVGLMNPKSKIFNEDVNERWDQADPGQEVPLIDKEYIEKPIAVKIINGKVESVGIGRDEPLWVVNFKRALAAQLTLQLDESSAIFSDVESKEFYSTNAVYSIMEGCPTGECQTYYHLSRVPEVEVETNRDILPLPEICSSDVYEIVKNRDFDKCKVLPVFNYFNTRGLECNLAEFGSCKNMLSRVDIVRVIGCVAKDGSFVVQNIKDTDKVVEKPFGYETEPLEGSSIQKWTLRNVRSAAGAASVLASRLPTDLQVHKTLVYAYDEKLSVHGPYLEKSSLHQHELPFVQEPSKDAVKSELVRLFSEVVSTLESDEYYADPVGTYVPAKINMIKTAMMYLNYQELDGLASNLLGPKSSTANQVFVDALVACGTNPAIILLKDLITQEQLTKEQAIQAVATLPATVKTPTKELLGSLVEFLRSDIVSSHRRLKITTALSLSLLVDKACVNTTDGFKLFPEMVMGQFCTGESNVVVNEVIPLLTEELNNADDEAEKIALLAALGNIGHEAIIPAVFPYISSCDPSTEQEFSWTERQRRSAKDGSKMDKKDLRKMWLEAKRGKSKAAKELEKKLEKESEEEEILGAKSPKARKQLAKDMKQRHKMEAEEREQEMQMRAWELQEKRKLDLERMQGKSLKKRAKLGKKGKKGKMNIWGTEEEEEEEEEEEDLSGFLGEQPWSASFRTLNVGAEEEEEEDEGVEDEALCNIVRMKAVYALSKLATEKNEAVLPILMPLTFNKEEETEVRLAALSLLFVHNLPAGFWTRVAISTWFEPNDHISTFIYTTIASLANNKDPKKRDRATKAEAVMPLVKPNRWAPHISTGSINGQFQERTRLGYLANTFTFGGYESFLPANMYQSIFIRMGPWTTKLLELSVTGKQLEKFVDQWIGQPTRRWQSSGVYGGVKGEKIASRELSEIHRELHIEARAQGKPELFIYLNFADNYQRFYHVDESSFQDLVTSFVRHQALSGSGGKVTTNYHKYYPIFSKMVRIPSAMGLAYGLISHHKSFSNIRSSLTGSMNLGGTTNAEGLVQPSAALKFHSKMNVELPFVRAVAASGVDITIRAALPGKLAVRGDYVNGKLEAVWKFLGDKVRVAHYNVIPFITVRDVNDFTPLMLLKETKPIALLDKLKESSNIYGARATGLNWVYVERHDAKALNTPLSFTKDTAGTIGFLPAPSTLRYCEHSLFLDVAKSETKAVKFQLSIDSKHQKQMTKSMTSRNIMSEGMFAGPYGKKLKAGKFMEEDIEDEWQQHKFSKLFKSLTSAYGFSIDSSVEFVSGGAGTEMPSGVSKAIRYGGSIAAGFDPLKQSHKAHFMVEKFHEEDPEANFVLCLDGNINWPQVFAAKRENFLKDEINTLGLLNINFGKSCTNDRQVSVKAEFTYSDEKEQQYTKYKESRMNELQCIADELKGHGMSEECVNTRRLATVLNKGIITVKYNEMPAAVRNATHKAENVLRHWLGAYLSDNQVQVRNENNQIRIETVYHPVLGTLDIRTYKPESNTFFHNIEVTPIAEAVVPFHPATTAYRAAFGGPGICIVDQDTVTTYDRVTYKASLSGCDTVITKDCSGRYKMAVLAREEANDRIVTVLLNKEKIEVSHALGRVRINGVEKVVSSAAEGIHQVLDDLNQVIATVRQTRDNLLEVASPTHWIRVTVGPKFISVMGSAVHRGRLCGLCGTQSGDKTDDLTGPRKCALPANLMDVAYELNRPAGCKSSAHLSKEVEDLREVQQTCKAGEESAVRSLAMGYKSRFGNPFTSEFGMRKSAVGSSCTAIRNKKIFRAGSQCYSVSPVTKCVQGCKPVSVMEKKVGFHCLPKNALAQHLEREQVRRPLDELVNKEIHTVENVKVPTACVPEY